MDQFNLLECTLRDGGYITNWQFSHEMICQIIKGLTDAHFDMIEVGYLNRKPYEQGSSVFQTIEQIAEYLPVDRHGTLYLAMADVQQFLPEDITPFTGDSIDGIRVVFYKHQIREALMLCKAVRMAGYKLLVQPMVTIDYSVGEYAQLVREVAKLDPFAVSVVDSFGYMCKTDFRAYFRILDNILAHEVLIGFHSHNNMDLAFVTAQDVLEYVTTRKLIVDCSLYGMGRGAGNLQSELIANYYNMTLGEKYDLSQILSLIGKYILPIKEKKIWGYSPYFLLTARYHCHPNFACYLLENHSLSVMDFERYLQMIPDEMKTKCRKPYVEQLFQEYKKIYKGT